MGPNKHPSKLTGLGSITDLADRACESTASLTSLSGTVKRVTDNFMQSLQYADALFTNKFFTVANTQFYQ